MAHLGLLLLDSRGRLGAPLHSAGRVDNRHTFVRGAVFRMIRAGCRTALPVMTVSTNPGWFTAFSMAILERMTYALRHRRSGCAGTHAEAGANWNSWGKGSMRTFSSAPCQESIK